MSPVTLDGFCRHLMEGGAPDVRLHPTAIAREFVDFFGMSAFPDMDEIKTLLENAGVRIVFRPARPEASGAITRGPSTASIPS